MTLMAGGRERPTLRQRLATGDPLLGTFVLIPRVEIVELLAEGGFDLAILDLEHGPYGVGDLMPLVAACTAAGVYSLVRVPDLAPQAIGAALDLGADGILVPHVDSAGAVSLVVQSGRFPPAGDRSLNPFVRQARYQGGQSFLASSNESVALIAMIEGKEGLELLPSLSADDGLDGIFIGPMDLSGALGKPGDPEHPVVLDAISGILDHARERGLAAGIYCPTPEAANRWLGLGARLVAVGADTHLIHEGFLNCSAAVSGRSEVPAGGVR